MTRPIPSRRPLSSGAIGLTAALYALILLASPALHHDLACHLKSRTHCTSCVVSISGTGVPGAAGFVAHDLQQCGVLAAAIVSSAPFAAVAVRSGRSPPR